MSAKLSTEERELHKKESDKKAYLKRKGNPEYKIYKNRMVKQWNLRNKDKLKLIKKKSSIKFLYGLSYDKYEDLVEQQNGCCAICDKATVLNIDHNHETGEIRGLLCNHCNLGLGLFKDSPILLIKASEYLI